MDAIRMMGIVKCFGPVRANDGIDLIVKQQEIRSTVCWVKMVLVKVP